MFDRVRVTGPASCFSGLEFVQKLGEREDMMCMLLDEPLIGYVLGRFSIAWCCDEGHEILDLLVSLHARRDMNEWGFARSFTFVFIVCLGILLRLLGSFCVPFRVGL